MADDSPKCELNSLKIAELKEQLQLRGLPVTGMKTVLVERLKNAGVTSVTLPVQSEEQSEEQPTVEAEAGNEEEHDTEGADEVYEECHSRLLEDEQQENDNPEFTEAYMEVTDETAEDEEQVEFAEETAEDTGDMYEETDEPYVEESADTNTATHEELEPDMEAHEDQTLQEEQAAEAAETEAVEEEFQAESYEDKENAVPVVENGTDEAHEVVDLSEQPPSPSSVPVVAPFTSDDVIQLGEGAERCKDDDISLVVNVDESQNEFDIPETPVSKSGEQSEKDYAGDGQSKKSTSASRDSKSNNKAEAKKEESSKDGAEQSSSPSKTAGKKDDKAKPNTTNRSLWISGLASTTRATDLKTLFSKYGKVAGAKVVTNAKSPGARCYGFVTMNTADEASKCIQYLHRTELHGRMISVERAKGDPSQTRPAPKKPVAKAEDAKKEEDKKKDAGASKDPKKDVGRTRSAHTNDRRRSGPERERPAGRGSHNSRHGPSDRRPGADRTTSGDRARPTSHTRGTSSHKSAAKDDEKKTENASNKKPEEKNAEKTDDKKPKKTDDKELLSLEKIKEAREQERQRRTARRMEQEERERERQMRVWLERQRIEGQRLQKERERLRLERERLEKERIEAEREKLRLERERRETERLALLEQRRIESMRFESRPHKRQYDGRGDDYWAEPKRAYDSGRGDRRAATGGGDRREVVRRDVPTDRDDRTWDDNRGRPVRYDGERRSGGGTRTERRSPRPASPPPVRRSNTDHHNSSSAPRHESYRGVRTERPARERPAAESRSSGRETWQSSIPETKDSRSYNRSGQAPSGAGLLDAPSTSSSNQWGVVDRRPPSHVMVQPQATDNRQWQASANIAPARSSVLSTPLLQSTPNPGFLASAANIMMGVGLARNNEQRYDAYKGMQSNLRRY